MVNEFSLYTRRASIRSFASALAAVEPVTSYSWLFDRLSINKVHINGFEVAPIRLLSIKMISPSGRMKCCLVGCKKINKISPGTIFYNFSQKKYKLDKYENV